MMYKLIKQHKAINICFVLLFIMGFLSLTKLGREELPEIGGEGLNIQAVLPGATPDEMDLQVARPLTSAVIDLPGVDEVSSVAKEGFLSLSISVKSDEPDLDGLRREIAQIVSQVPDLPADLEGPFVSRQFDRLFPPMTLILRGGDDLARHKMWVSIEHRLMSLPEVDAIETLGDRKRRIEIRANPLVLQRTGLRMDAFSNLVGGSITDTGAGNLRGNLDVSRVRTHQQPADVAELKNIMIPSEAGVLPLSYYAEVVDSLGPKSIAVDYARSSAWYINLYRRNSSNVSEMSARVKQVVSEINQSFHQQHSPFELVILQDRSRVVTNNLTELTESIVIGMAMVFVILWLFLGKRNAFYAAIGIPFSFFVAFIAMDILNLNINMLTLFGLVLVCGMIVDDAIVVLENINRKQGEGLTGIASISQGVREVAPAVIAATGTTIAVFMPLMLMTGGMGAFVSQIPKVAILALVASLVECFIILPIHLYEKGTHRQTDYGRLQKAVNHRMDALASRFARFSGVLVRYPFRSLAGFAALIAITSAIAFVNMDFKLFEATEMRSVRFSVEFDDAVDLKVNGTLINSAVNAALDEIKAKQNPLRDLVVISGYKNYNYRTTISEHFATIEILLTEAAVSAGIAAEVADYFEEQLTLLPGLVRI
ncbi:MAG: efflux RND transporter permease subunit, partial [Halieaceae bacterium]|nr:efflux RND transporter permease subunit [Halieaceae bacterium]